MLAAVNGAQGDVLARPERAAHPAAFGDAAAFTGGGDGEAWEAGDGGHAADVPDLEFGVVFGGVGGGG